MPKVKPRSSKRVPAPKESDFDHEIMLEDHSAPTPRIVDPEEAAGEPSASTSAAAGPSQHSQDPQLLVTTLDNLLGISSDQEAENNQQGQETDRPSGLADRESVSLLSRHATADQTLATQVTDTPQIDLEAPQAEPPMTAQPRPKSPKSAIDILYENQRGGFLCGFAMFSSKALGNLDPPAWTNFVHHPSPTDTNTAQVPDPSWEWVWPDWRVNHEDGVDEDGWEYSFMFAKPFSWHGPSWWNSCVRRRAWIRRRAKKGLSHASNDPYLLSPEYFSVRGSVDHGQDHSRSPSQDTSRRSSKRSLSANREAEVEEVERPPIEDMEDLLRVLRTSRIDREKIEAVDSYLENEQDNLVQLQEEMHEIMSLFVFQASRRILLVKLTEVHDKVSAAQDAESSTQQKRKLDNLSAAIKHADEEVRRLEYWSDIKGMAEKGHSEGAVDEHRGWDETWQGVDKSGPNEPNPKTTA